MALRINASGDVINAGPDARLNGLTAFSFAVWFRFATVSTTGENLLFSRLTDLGNRAYFGLPSSSSELRVLIPQSGTTADTMSSGAGVLTVGAWYFAAFSYDQAATPRIRIYLGGLSGLAQEVTYGSRTDGSGTMRSVDESTLAIGNRNVGTRPMMGDYAWVGFYNRVLALGELQSLQFAPRVITGTLLHSHLGLYGGLSAVDHSGNQVAMTCNGTGTADHAPIAYFYRQPARAAIPATTASPVSGQVSADPAAATALGMAPAVAGVRSAVVAAVCGTVTSQAMPPALIAVRSASVTSSAAAALSQANNPALSGVRQAQAIVGAAQVSAQMVAPAVSSVRGSLLSVSTAAASAQAAAPTVASVRSPTLHSPTGLAQAQGVAPSVSAGGSANLQPPVAEGSIQAIAPTVAAIRAAQVQAVGGDASAQAIAPNVASGGSAVVQAAPAGALAGANSPDVQAVRTVSVMATTANSMVLALSPQASSGRSGSLAAVPATAAAALIAPTVVAEVSQRDGLVFAVVAVVIGRAWAPQVGQVEGSERLTWTANLCRSQAFLAWINNQQQIEAQIERERVWNAQVDQAVEQTAYITRRRALEVER